MKPRSKPTPGLLAALAIIIALCLISWKQEHSTKSTVHYRITEDTDTLPDKKKRPVRDLDEAISELEALDINSEMEKAMGQLEKAFKELDVQKIMLDAQRSLKDEDFAKMESHLKKAMEEIKMQNLEKEISNSLAKIDWKQISEELKNVKDIDFEEMNAGLEKVRVEIEKIKPQLERDLGKAKIEVEKAKAELKEYRDFIDGLENDGLINKKEDYLIKHREGKLLINEREASAQTYGKYRNFLDKHKEFTINKSKDDFDIDLD